MISIMQKQVKLHSGVNTLAPFSSSHKPTCGYFYDGKSDHKKRLIGINSINLNKWRVNRPSTVSTGKASK